GCERIRSEYHRSTLVDRSALVGHQVDDRMWRVLVELGGVRPLEAARVPGKLHDRELHPQADPEKRDLVLACETHRGHIAFGPPVAEATGHQNGIETRQGD